MEKNFIADRITALRLKKEISEYKLSQDIGKCDNYINKVSSGKLIPTIASLSIICEYFGITLAQFFQEDSPTDSLATLQLLAILPTLNEEQIQSLLVITQAMKNSNAQI